MDKLCVDLSNCRALGDTLCVSPVIKKISKSYNSKIYVISNYPELFSRSPYVISSIKYDENTYEHLKNEFNLIKTFNIDYKPDGTLNKHNVMDIRQFHAVNLGFMLSKEELELEYTPENTDHVIPGLPEKYVLIHPVKNWDSRTWGMRNWIILTKLLNEKGISVVSIGKDSLEYGGSVIDKPAFDFQIDNGLNLINKTTLDETWYLISNSMCFVTMDSGLLHLAGTTDCEIIQLGSSINPEFRAPYRNGRQDYKYHYVSGGCNIHCASNMKYGVREWGTIQGVPSLIGCLENKKSFECHPSPLSIYNKILEII